MKLYNTLEPELVHINLEQANRDDILHEMVHNLKLRNKIPDENLAFRKLLEREKLGTTSIGNHAAVPHAKLKDIKKPIVAVGVSKKGVRYHEDDEQSVHLIILILSPNNSPNIHLQVLAAAASLIKKTKNLVKEISAIESAVELIELLKKYETLDD
ncbi:MAG: PTS sugar transporter subunit IIA [Candidatus Aminicenantes bacterium]|nr:PTS sugar transporter subunit IIA [Candidatus Aminicenantes bacterium]